MPCKTCLGSWWSMREVAVHFLSIASAVLWLYRRLIEHGLVSIRVVMLWHLIPGVICMGPVLVTHRIVLVMHLLAFLLYFFLLLVTSLTLVLGVLFRQRRTSQARLTSEFTIILLVNCRVAIRHNRQRLRCQELPSAQLTGFIIGRQLLS